MAFTSITSAEVAAGKATSTTLMNKIRTNLDDLDSRIEASTNRVTIWDQVINVEEAKNGTMVWSFETEAKFQAANGDGWSLIDASAGSYIDANGDTITIPAAQLYFLMNRGDATVDEESAAIALGDKLSHRTGNSSGGVTTGADGVHNHSYTRPSSNGAAGASTGGSTSGSTGDAGSHNHSVGGFDTVTRPKALVANLFIKVKPNTYSKRLIYKIPQGITLNTAVLTQLVAGTSGTTEIDVKTGATLGSLSSIFTTKPSCAYSDGDYYSSTNGDMATTTLTLNHWLVLDILSVQDRDPRLHIHVAGEWI